MIPDEPMELDVQEPAAGLYHVRAVGRLGWGAQETIKRSLPFLGRESGNADADRQPRAKDVAVDLGGVSFLDSAGISSLLSVQQAVQKGGGKMLLCNVPPLISKAFDVVGMSRLIPIVEDFNRAREVFGE